MAWPLEVLEKSQSFMESLAKSVYEIVNEADSDWVVARIDLIEPQSSAKSLLILPRNEDYSASLYFFRQDGSATPIPVNRNIDNILSQLWSLRGQLPESDRFHGFNMSISESGEVSIEYKYPGATPETDPKQIDKLTDLYHRHAAMVFDRQVRLSEWIQKNASPGWDYTISAAQFSLGTTGPASRQIKLEAHVVGSYAEPDYSWLWAWDNPSMQLTEKNKQLKDLVRALGTTHSAELFEHEGKVELASVLDEDLSGFACDVLGMILAGELQYFAYHKVPFAQGAAVILIRDERLEFEEEAPLARIAKIFPMMVSAMPILDHKAALIGYSNSYGVIVQDQGTNLVLSTNSGGSRVAEFDNRNQFRGID